MTSVNDFFPSKYLSAADLGGDTTVVIEGIGREDFSGELKPILHLRDSKDLVLNKTNAKTIASVYGDEIDHWTGKAIILYATEVDFRGEIVQAIRIRREHPKAPEAYRTGALTTAQIMELKELYTQNDWPIDEVKAAMDRLAGVGSLSQIPQSKLIQLQEYFGQAYKQAALTTADNIPF